MNGPDWVVMSGGAAQGVFMLGALDVMVGERGFEPQHFAGISVGALLAVDLAHAPPGQLRQRLDTLIAIWLDEVPARLRRGRRRGTRALLERRLDPEQLRSSGRKFRAGAVDLRTGRYRRVTEHDVDIERLMGATALPFVDRPIRIDGERWVDGVLRHSIPLHDVLVEAPEHVLILTTARTAITPRGGRVRRALAVALHEFAFLKELRTAVAVRRAGGPRIEVLTPTEMLAPPLRFDRPSLLRSFDHGRAVARGEGWRWLEDDPPDGYAPFLG